MVIPKKVRLVHGKRIYTGIANPRGRPDTEVTSYFKESELKRLERDLIGKPVFINHMTKAPNGEYGIPAGTPYAPSGTVIGSKVRSKDGKLMVFFMTHRTPNGELAEKFLQAEKADERMTMLSLGYDINIVNGVPVGNDVTELSICYQGAHQGTDIISDDEINDFISSEKISATASFVIGTEVIPEQKIIAFDINKLKRKREEEQEEVSKKSKMEEDTSTYFRNFDQCFPRRPGFNVEKEDVLDKKRYNLNPDQFLGPPGTDTFLRHLRLTPTVVNKVIATASYVPDESVKIPAGASADVPETPKQLTEEEKKELADDEAHFAYLSKQIEEVKAKLQKAKQLQEDVNSRKIAVNLDAREDLQVPPIEVPAPPPAPLIPENATPEQKKIFEDAFLAQQELYDIKKATLERQRNEEIQRRGLLQAQVAKVLPQLLVEAKDPNIAVRELEVEMAKAAVKPNDLFQGFVNKIEATASNNSTTSATKIEETLQQLMRNQAKVRRNIDNTLDSVKPVDPDVARQTTYVENAAKHLKQVTQIKESAPAVAYDDLPPLEKAVFSASYARGAPPGRREPDSKHFERVAFWSKLMQEAGPVGTDVKMTHLYPTAEPGKARYQFDRLPQIIQATASYQIEENKDKY